MKFHAANIRDKVTDKDVADLADLAEPFPCNEVENSVLHGYISARLAPDAAHGRKRKAAEDGMRAWAAIEKRTATKALHAKIVDHWQAEFRMTPFAKKETVAATIGKRLRVSERTVFRAVSKSKAKKTS